MASGEVWKQIPFAAEGYEISSKGRCRHLNSKYKYNEYGSGNGNGYLRTGVKLLDGSHDVLLVHRIVAITFLGEPEEYREVNHKDGNRKNNAVENLEWVTRQENCADCAKRNAPILRKISEEDVEFIRSSNMRQVDLARMFGVHQTAISKIKRNVIYKTYSAEVT